MVLMAEGTPLPSALSEHIYRKDVQPSASLLGLGTPAPPSPPVWSRRTGRRVRVLSLAAFVALYIIYHITGVVLSSTTSADSQQVKTSETAGPGTSVLAYDAINEADTGLTAMDKEVFIQDILATDIRGVYDGQSLYDLCNARDNWQPSIVMDCGRLRGGYGGVRNAMLTCLRLAIEAGGSLLLPQISRRDPEDITYFRSNDTTPFSSVFDEAHLKSTLKTYCPQLIIHDSRAAIEGFPGISQDALNLTPEDIPDVTVGSFLIKKPAQFHASFHDWLGKAHERGQLPVRISLAPKGGGALRWPTIYDYPSFSRSFSSVVRPSRRVRVPAAEALYRLVNYHVDPSLVAHKAPADFTLPFIGIHLRTERDARQQSVTDYGFQTEYYLSRLRSGLLDALLPTPSPSFSSSSSPGPGSNATVPVYIASGDQDEIARFAQELLSLSPSIRVLTKSSLLPADALSALTWDQQALVDFQILERAAFVMGVRESSFAWTVALKRAAAMNWVVGGFPEGPCWVVDGGEERGGTGADVAVEEGDKDGAGEGQEQKTGPMRRAEEGKGTRRGCKIDLAPQEYWHDQLSVLVGNPGVQFSVFHGAPTESVDDLRWSIWP